MFIAKIKNANLVFGPPKDWNSERDGECSSLPVFKDGETFSSAWKPTAQELAALNAGHAVILTIFSAVHPPVSIGVSGEPVP